MQAIRGFVGITTMTEKKAQADKFKEAAREHGADEDEQRWEERLKKVAKAEPKA